MTFVLGDSPDEKLRLRSFSATSKGLKSVLTITIETEEPYALAHAIERLGEVDKGQRSPPPAKSKSTT